MPKIDRYKRVFLTPRRRQVLGLIAGNGAISISGMARELGIGYETVREHLIALRRLGLVSRGCGGRRVVLGSVVVVCGGFRAAYFEGCGGVLCGVLNERCLVPVDFVSGDVVGGFVFGGGRFVSVVDGVEVVVGFGGGVWAVVGVRGRC